VSKIGLVQDSTPLNESIIIVDYFALIGSRTRNLEVPGSIPGGILAKPTIHLGSGFNRG